ncbi:MAG: carboxypeptidase-like regulatory domain-containing protein [Bacteroidota bacterium]
MKVHLALLFLFFATFGFSQESEFIAGMLMDSKTNEPVVFATIGVKGKVLGVVSNQDGSFRIPKRFKEMGETLEISCLGYEKKEVLLTDLYPIKNNIVKLVPSVLKLEEAILIGRQKKPPSPRKIIKRAIEKISINYPFEPFSYIGYYRDYQEKDDKYLNLNEAILKVFDAGFDKNDYLTTQSQIFDSNENLDFVRDSYTNISYNYLTGNKIIDNAKLLSFGGNEFYILRIHNAIRNYNVMTFSYVDVFEKDLIKNHSLTRKNDVLLGDEKMFVIGLESSNHSFINDGYTKHITTGNIKSEGEIYISQSSYAIHKIVYKMFDYTESKKPKKRNDNKSPKLLYEIAIEYKKYKGKMYPNYLSLHNAFKVKKTHFRIEEIVFEIKKKRFVIKTNNPPIFVVQPGQPNVLLSYKKKKIDIKEVKNTYDGILVYPDDKQIDEILKELELNNDRSENIAIDLFHFEFSYIIDENGYTLNKFLYEEYSQYREFFTQRVITDSVTLPPNELLMRKDRPIFKNQPVSSPDNFSDYWMNTPLQNIDN